MNITLDLSIDEANTIITGLRELPYKVAEPLIKKIVEEAKKQANETENQ